MKQLFFITLTSFYFSFSFAQDTSYKASKPRAPYLATVRLLNGQVSKGWLYNLNDSQLVLLEGKNQYLRKMASSSNVDPKSMVYYPISQVNSITTNKKNSVLKGGLIGMAVGFTSGAIMGLAEGSDEILPYPSNGDIFAGLAVSLNNTFAMTAGEKAVLYGTTLGASGAIVGAIIGAVAKKKFTIGGKKEKFNDLQADLMKRLIVK